jgi:hypothetical protein
MYVLVLIMMFEGRIKVQAFDGLFMDAGSCNELAVEMENRLMSARPTPESSANTYCFQVPEIA